MVALRDLALAMGFVISASVAGAASWTLNGESSNLSFGSIKKDTVGESHMFERLSGAVAEDGAVSIDIDLTSLETFIDIRNERMAEHVFKGVATAGLTAQLDMAEMTALAVGGSTVTDVEATLSLLGKEISVETEMFVARMSETQVMVTSNGILFVSTEDLGVNAGVDTLMELASLPGITRTVPVTFRLVFDAAEGQAQVAPAEAEATPQLAAATGDAKAGKRAFRRCSACHSLEAGKNKSGPSLYQVIGKPAASNPEFKYSKAMTASGLTWDIETLTAYLTKPKDVVKGTSMQFPGLKKEADVANVIAYIQAEGS